MKSLILASLLAAHSSNQSGCYVRNPIFFTSEAVPKSGCAIRSLAAVNRQGLTLLEVERFAPEDDGLIDLSPSGTRLRTVISLGAGMGKPIPLLPGEVKRLSGVSFTLPHGRMQWQKKPLLATRTILFWLISKLSATGLMRR